MSTPEPIPTQVRVTYDSPQHCMAIATAPGKTVAMDCPYTGKGEELSPTNLFAGALAGCMLLSMGTWAVRQGLDLTGTEVDVGVHGTPSRLEAMELTFHVPLDLEGPDRMKLERAAEGCPIKHTFGEHFEVRSHFHYPAMVRQG